MTPHELPIACSLGATALTERLAHMSALGSEALVDSRVTATNARLRFRDTAETRSRLKAIVSAEAECCAFLAMQITDDVDAVALTIDAPADAQPVLEELVAAFRGQPGTA